MIIPQSFFSWEFSDNFFGSLFFLFVSTNQLAEKKIMARVKSTGRPKPTMTPRQQVHCASASACASHKRAFDHEGDDVPTGHSSAPKPVPPYKRFLIGEVPCGTSIGSPTL